MSLLLFATLQTALLAGSGGIATIIDSPSVQDAAPAQDYESRLLQARDLATSGDPGQREQAITLYGAMLQTSPDNSDVLLARGRTYAWMGRYAEAEADLRAVTERKADYADAWSALGDMYLWNDRPKLAADAYTHWVVLAPEASAPLIARGRAWRAAGEMDLARADFAAAGEHGAEAVQIASLNESTVLRLAVPDAFLTDGYRWSLRAGIDHTGFSGGREAWNDSNVSLRRKFERGSLALEWLRADHFNRSSNAWALDGYVSLWSRAYANLRYQRGPRGGLMANQAWRAELFQGIGSGWELSASIDHLRFSADTEFYGLGVGRYVGNWYLRYKLQHVPGASSGSWSQRAVVRNYYRGNADDYLEFSAGHGRSMDLDRFGALVRNSNASFGVNWVRYFRQGWGFKLGGGYADDAGGFNEQQLSLALYRRW